jgi:hypothetical protein
MISYNEIDMLFSNNCRGVACNGLLVARGQFRVVISTGSPSLTH